jgi:glutamine amidotransferase
VIAILDYGSGNLHSVSRAIAHVGGDPVVTADSGEIERADALVIPGVGAFGACAAAIRDRGHDAIIRSWADRGRPIFGVCVGLQILLESSEEDDGVGLAILDGASLRLPATVKVPHMGWNNVSWTRSHPWIEGIPSDTRFYFVHSFAPAVDDRTVGTTEYGVAFSSALSWANVFATQFHPEKSGEAGLQIYETFVKGVST